MQTRLLLLLGACFFIGSCDKDDEIDPSVATLTRGSWAFSKMEANGGDISSAVPACVKDNAITFYPEFDGKVEEGATVCSPSYQKDFAWEFRDNKTKLFVTAPIFPGGPTTYDVVTLTDDLLVLSQGTSLIPGSGSVTAQIFFVH